MGMEYWSLHEWLICMVNVGINIPVLLSIWDMWKIPKDPGTNPKEMDYPYIPILTMDLESLGNSRPW